ncbi:EF-hand calcium-binding domain-containing protein 4B-like isoform X1 [Clytia hemisphaerica]|uniref:Uncharacterized protein n=1 Tax=Clytia hemisphaerica TaxID=252671 RepID=A0A7M6DQR9_9CNID
MSVDGLQSENSVYEGGEFINNFQSDEQFYYDDDGLLEPSACKINIEDSNDLSTHRDGLVSNTVDENNTDFQQIEQNFNAELPVSEKRRSHLFQSVDDITRDSPIRKAACATTSCALCEANARNLNVKLTIDGGFQLRKAASCSICTWDIEEFEFDDNLCDTGDLSDGELSIDEEDLDADEGEESLPISGRNRSNSYSRAMEDEVDYQDEHNSLANTDSQLSLSQRLPPDGGEIEESPVKEERVFHKERLIKSSSPKVRSSRKKGGLRNQSSIEKKISQELDEIFGKLHRSPQQSFDTEDTFDLDDSSNSIKRSSKRGSFRKLIRTPSFLKRHKKTKLDTSKSRSVEFLYTSEPPIDVNIKKSMSTMDVSTYYQDLVEGEEENLELSFNEAFSEYLNDIGGTVLFSGNEVLRFLWHQITTYQHDLIVPFDDFLKSVLDEIQQAYKKCQDLESTLSMKAQQQEKETSKIYEDAETALRQEREQLQEKHSEKEDQIKSELLRAINAKDQEIQDSLKMNNEILLRDSKLTNENHELKQVLEKLEEQHTISTANEAMLIERNEYLKHENISMNGKIKLQEDALQQLHEQLMQLTSNHADSEEHYEKLLRRFKDLTEEKEQLETSCSNLTSDLEELKTNRLKPRGLEKQLSWSTTSSLDFDRPSSPYDENSNHNRSLTNSTTYNKATDSAWILTKQRSRNFHHSSTEIDDRNRFIQTPSGLTALRSARGSKQDINEENNDLATPLPSHRNIPSSSSRNLYKSSTPYNNNFSIPPPSSSRKLVYGNSKTPLRLASSRSNEFKVVFAGDPNVGKTSLIRRICHGRFKENREVTLEMDCATKLVECQQKTVSLKLWDTVGTEKFNSIPPSYFRKSDIVVLVYDIYDEGSFCNARKWLRQIHDYTNDNIFLFLVGNKSDMHHKRAVAPKRAECLASENDAMFIETSAKTGENTERLCAMIASTLLDREETVFIRNDFEGSLCSLSYSFKRTNEVSICCS